MIKTKGIIKNIVLGTLPPSARQSIKKIHYYRKLRGSNTSDERDLNVLKYFVRPGDNVIDMGANFGLYTRFLSEGVGPRGTVYSVEPIPETYDILKSNVRRLGLWNVKMMRTALSDRVSQAQMEIPDYDVGGPNYYRAHLTSAGSGSDRSVPVRTTTVDRLFSPIKSISFVKCDVEGHELQVLLGAQTFLQTHRPAWLMELSGNPDSSKSNAYATIHFLSQYGYHPYVWTGSEFVHRRRGDSSVNYYFLTARHRAQLAQEGLTKGQRRRRSKTMRAYE